MTMMRACNVSFFHSTIKSTDIREAALNPTKSATNRPEANLEVAAGYCCTLPNAAVSVVAASAAAAAAARRRSPRTLQMVWN